MSRVLCLQDWVTVRGATTIGVTQDEERWLDLDGFSDATCWIDVAEVTPPNGTTTNSISLGIETAAVCDEAFFTPMTPVVTLGSAVQFYQASATPIVTRSVRSGVTSNLMRYVRWKLTPVGSGTWDVTFRIRVVAARSESFSPLSFGSCALWLRADAGITLGTGQNVSNWKDLSGSGNDVQQSSSSLQPTWVASGINNLPAVHFLQSAKQVLFSTTTPSLGGAACMIAVVSPTAGSTFNNTRVLATTTPTQYFLGSSDAGGTKWRLIVNNVWGTPGGSTAAGDYVILGNYDPANSNLGVLYQNGVAVSSNTMSSPTPAANAFNVGSTSGDVFTNDYFNGNIAEVLFFTRALTASELTRIHRYLGARYGIAVP